MKAYIVWPMAVVVPPLVIEGLSRTELTMGEVLTVLWVGISVLAIVGGIFFERSRAKQRCARP